MEGHRFLPRLHSHLNSGFKQVLLHGLIEDLFFLPGPKDQENYLSIQHSLYRFFTEYFQQDDGLPQIILFYAGQNQDKILTQKRPIFADELMNKGQKMRQLTADLIKGGLPNFDSMQTNEWMRQFYELLCQNSYRIILVLEKVDTYWRRDLSGSLTHNEIDKYFSLYREQLGKPGSPHYIVFTSSINDVSGFHLSHEQIGQVKISLPNEFEVGSLFSLNFKQFDFTVRNELLKELGRLPLVRSKAIIEDCVHTETILNLLTLRRYITGVDSEFVWGECLREKLQLTEEIFGQERAIAELDDFLNEVKEEISYRKTTGKIKKRLLGYRLLAGPTGVGKTEYFRQLCESFAKHDIAHRIFNCTEYTQEHTVLRLTGAPPSYVGSPRGEMGEFLIEHPNSIILFDEWEKAHMDILRLFLKIFEGELTLGSGETVDLSNCLILLTSNAGAAFIKPTNDENFEQINQANVDLVLRALRNKGVPPELEGRIKNSIVIFDHISDVTGVKIIDKRLEKLKTDFSKYQNVKVEIDESVYDFFKNQFQLNRKSGARAVVSQIDALRGDVMSQVVGNKELKVWVDSSERIRFDKGAKPYLEEPMANLWRYALGAVLKENENQSCILEEAFDRIVGQEHIKEKILTKLTTLLEELPMTYPSPMMRNLVDVFVLGGPTGVGKTETFNLLEEVLGDFHIKKEIFSMTEYQNESDIYKLIGSPPGYTGSNVGLMGEFLLNNPNSIVCFDEFEKCHLNIKLMFLKLLEGKLSLSSGDLVDFSNVLFIFTTNAGNRFIKRCSSVNDEVYEQNVDNITYALQTDYKVPDELIGRLKGQILPFNPIDHAEAKVIIQRKLDEHEAKFHPSITTYLLDQFIHEPRFGARDIVINTRNKLIVVDNLYKKNKEDEIYVDKSGKFKQGSAAEFEYYQHIKPYSDEEIQIQAFHEAGHAVCVAVCLQNPMAVKELSLSAPFNINLPRSSQIEGESRVLTEDLLLGQICILYGGRAAELRRFGFSSENCQEDIKEATRIARKMIFELGMTQDLVPVSLEEFQAVPQDYQIEVLKILKEMDESAKTIVNDAYDLIKALADKLKDQEYLSQADFLSLWKEYEHASSN